MTSSQLTRQEIEELIREIRYMMNRLDEIIPLLAACYGEESRAEIRARGAHSALQLLERDLFNRLESALKDAQTA